MQIQANEKETCVLDVSYTADAEEVKAKTNEVLAIFKDAQVPGFRKGKAPLKSIHMRYFKQIQDATKKALQEEAYHNTLFDRGIKPFGLPEVLESHLEGDTFSCRMVIRKKPDVSLAKYRDMRFVVEPPRDVESEFEAAKTQFCIEQATTADLTAEDTIQTADQLTVSYETFADGERVEELCREKEGFTIGETKMPGFDEQLSKAKIGETVEIVLTGPETALPAIANKALRIVATVVAGVRRTPAVWSEELATKLSFESLAKMEERIRSQVLAKIQQEFTNRTRDMVSTALVQNNPVEPPPFMVENEAMYLAGQHKMDWNAIPDMMKQSLRDMATNNVKLALVCEAIRESDPDAQMTADEINRKMQRELQSMDFGKLLTEGQTVKDFIGYLRQIGYIDFMQQRIRDEHVLEVVTNSCQFVPPTATDTETATETQTAEPAA
jgi:trigger factor